MKELKGNPAINLKKAEKGTTTVMNKADKIYEAKVQLDNRKHYELLKTPLVLTTQETDLYMKVKATKIVLEIEHVSCLCKL